MMQDPLLSGVDAARRNWAWLLVLGIVLLLVGIFALSSTVYVTLVSMVFFASLLLVGGVMHLIGAFSTRGSGGFALHLLAAVLDIVLGVLILRAPGATAVGLTLLIAAFLLAGGTFRIGVAISGALPNSGWVGLSGLINVLLGLALIFQWPYSGLWFIGLCIGIDMIFRGWSWIMAGLCLRKSPRLA